MKTQIFRFLLYSIVAGLTCLNLTAASSPPSGENGVHFCGFTEHQSDTRRYARSLANLDVGEPRMVRLIYFTPNDWPYRVDVVQKMKEDMHKIQAFYAEQMGAHGYGEVTFRVETDPQGQPLVHHVNGKHPFSHYDNTLGSEVFIELQAAFDFHANIYFIVLGTDALRQGDGQGAEGVGHHIWGKNGGVALVPNAFSWDLVAHELGHAFGLGHDFRDGAYLMSYGPGQNRLSDCAAEFLSVHPYFNPDIPIEAGEPPTIELVSPRRYPAGSRSIPVRLQINDPEGVHQVLLFAQGGLQACRGLESDGNAVAEFAYDGGFGLGGFTSLSDSMGHTIGVHAVDTDGNVSETFFTLAEESPHHIATLEAHTGAVRSVSFSRDGTLASGGRDGTVRLWDAAARQNIATFEGHMNTVESVAFSPDGTLASGSGDGTIMLWDIAERQRIATLEGRRDYIYSVSFSPDGGSLARGDSQEVQLWDVATRGHIATLPHGDHVFSVSFSRNGIIASGSEDRTVKLWDVATREHIATLPHENIVLAVAFSLDGGILVSGGWGDIELWDVATKTRLDTLTHGAIVSSVSFSTDGETLASGGWDGTVKLWDMTTRENFATFGPTSGIYCLSFSPDGRTIASGTTEGTIELWDTSRLIDLRLEALAEVAIPDPNLRAAIATALGITRSDSIRRVDMTKLIGLRANEANIIDLTGLEGATNLKQLFFAFNNIPDISAVAGLISLTDLSLSDNSISDISAVSGLTNLRQLVAWGNSISDISAVAGLTKLKWLNVARNNISDVSSLAGLTNLASLSLGYNNISDIAPLVENTGLTSGDMVNVVGNPLSYRSVYTYIPTLQERGVEVTFNSRTPQQIRIVSGNDQQGLPGAALKKPFVIEVQDERDDAFEGVPVTFTVTAGGGTLSATSTLTDAAGRAESTLTLGPNPGTNTVTVSVAGIPEGQTFNAVDIRVPKTLEIISGNDQEGLPGAALDKPFVVEVRDRADTPVPGVEVTFSVTGGGGTLSVTSATTDKNGRAESILILGSNAGTNTVAASVTGIQGEQTFSAEGIRIPETLDIISGNDQEGAPGAALENPFAVEVRDQFDKPFPDAEVTFTVTRGGGTLSVTSATTDGNGRAESILILGSNAGTNTVAASVTGIQGEQTFSAEGVRIPETLDIISGGDQEGLPGEVLEKPFVVEVRDQTDKPLPGVQVTFSVTSGGGTLSVTSATTNSNGRAESTLTLGPNPGRNTVTVSVTGIQEQQTFTAEGIRIPLAFWIISGDKQQGLLGEALANPFVVEVRDQSGDPLPGVQVAFSVSIGGGMLSATSATTDVNGRAESTLTLGPNPGTNTVTVSVAGIPEGQTFNAVDIRVPKTLEIISGNDQEGLPGAALDKPFVVEVRDRADTPVPGVEVTFSVTGGGGTLSVTSATTDKNGRAESILILGSNAGTNTVTVSVAWSQEEKTFSAEGIRIRDPNLRAAIATTLGKPPSAPFVRAHIPALTELYAPEANISDLTGLESATNLTSLTLHSNNISDISAVAGLTNLTSLTLYNNNISDISVVAGLTNLTFLSLWDNNISDISAVAGLTNLTFLSLWDNNISDISAVAGLTNLKTLELGDNNISNISVVAGLTNLTYLNLWGNNTSDISVVAGLTKLASLYLGGNNISDISVVAGLTNLTRLYLGDNNITDISPLVENTGLGSGHQVDIVGNPLSYSSIYTHIPVLQERGVEVSFDHRTPQRIRIVSGNDQQGLPGAALEKPLIVEVQDERGDAFEEVPITFTVTNGGGTLSVTSATTDSNGRAESILMLGPNPGTNTVEVGVTGIQEKQSVSAIAELPPIPQDVNRDDVVNILDLVLVASVLGDEGRDLDADVNRDGVVNILDLVLVAGAFGNVAAAPSANPRALAMLTAKDVGQWLAQAGELELTEATSQRGVLFLEQLLAALTPTETALLPNFPNPFNPETWIPYQLAEDADVTLTIHALNGRQVRRLKLGHQTAGTYYSRSRAAYWDGKNKFGEQVASGVYFYTLTAGDYSATRKMLIIK